MHAEVFFFGIKDAYFSKFFIFIEMEFSIIKTGLIGLLKIESGKMCFAVEFSSLIKSLLDHIIYAINKIYILVCLRYF